MLEYLSLHWGVPPVVLVIADDPMVTHDHNPGRGFELVEMVPESLAVHAQFASNTCEIDAWMGYNGFVDHSTVRVVENVLRINPSDA